MNNREIETIISTGIATMTLSHKKDILPHIFESLDLKEYYEIFDELDDSFYVASVISEAGEEVLSYHNKVHAQAVALNCYEAMHSTLTEFSKADQQALMVAALYHDTRHTRVAPTDSINIGMALKTLDAVHKTVVRKLPKLAYQKAVKLIRHTEYPYVVTSANIKCPLSPIIRDADLMMAYETDYLAIELYTGLFNELVEKCKLNRESELTKEAFIEGNTKFLQKVQWNTRWARNKAFVHNFPRRIVQLKELLAKV